jgi:hypothetical protein
MFRFKSSARSHVVLASRRRGSRGGFKPALERLEERNLLANSSLVYPGADGSLIYQPDARGNRIEDFSMVGYETGIVPLPDTAGGVSVPVQVTLSPTSGDQTARIQAAINQVSALPLDSNGFRGAVLLNAGEYPINGQLQISASGVVLEGVSSDPSSGTRLRATGTSQRTLIQISGSGSRTTVSGTTHNIIDNYVPVGAVSFDVDSTANWHVGDTIIVHRPSPANWIHDIGMDLLTNPWQPNSKNLDWDRVITDIEGNTVTIDAPLTNSLEQQYGGGSVHRYSWAGRLNNVGVENLYGFSDHTSSTDENHSWTLIDIKSAQNGWVHDVVSQYFAFACIEVDGGAKWVTVQDCQCLDPISQVTGGRRYSFDINDGAQLSLFLRDYARQGRHDFTVQSLVAGPNAFVDCSSDQAYAESGPHQRWSTGTLYDNVETHGNSGSGLNIRNAGNEGSGHGWQGANYVIWNSTADRMNISRPPTAQNWVIGPRAGSYTGNAFYESRGTQVSPQSLYFAQLSDRLAAGGVDRREYWLGGNNNFTGGDPLDTPYVDSGWYSTVAGALGTGQTIIGFDDLTRNAWIPFSFAYTVPAGEQVVGGSLSLGLRRTGGSSSSDDIRIYLNSLDNVVTVGSLGWLPLSSTTTKGVVMDLSGQLNQLQGGLLNVALENNAGVAWAVLDLKLAPAVTQVDLSASFNRIGLVNDGTTFSGGLDGHGYAYSANLLGNSVVAGGYTFKLGAANTPSAVSALGQTIALPPGQYSTLAFLGTGVNGNQADQTFTVNYTDGSSDTFTQSLSDWGRPQNYPGETIAAAMSYRDRSDGTMNIHTYNLYLYSFATDSTKTVAGITLPADANVEMLAVDLIGVSNAGAVQAPVSQLRPIAVQATGAVLGPGQLLLFPQTEEAVRAADTADQQQTLEIPARISEPARDVLWIPPQNSELDGANMIDAPCSFDLSFPARIEEP